MFRQAREAWVWALFHKLEGIKAGTEIAPGGLKSKTGPRDAPAVPVRLTNAAFIMMVGCKWSISQYQDSFCVLFCIGFLVVWLFGW